MKEGGRTALVVGGSLAGLLIGNILAREGWQVRVLERVSSGLDGRGAGIATHDELFAAMRRAGAQVDHLIGIAVRGRASFDSAGRQTDFFAYPQYLTSWSGLYRRLVAALPEGVYQTGVDVVDVVDGEGTAVAIAADGACYDADIVVAADGIWSVVRDKYNTREKPTYAGYVAWRGLVPEEKLAPEVIARYGDIHAFFTTDTSQLVHFAVTGPDDSVEMGRRRFSFLWYRPYSFHDELPDLLTDTDGNRHPTSISPLKIAPHHIDKLRKDALAVLPPHFAETVCKADMPFVQPIYDLMVSRMAYSRVALVGDSAFVARPHVGAGVAKAGGDAVALAEALAAFPDVPSALKSFEETRLPFGRAIVNQGRYLGGYLGKAPDSLQSPPLDIAITIRESAMPLHLLNRVRMVA